MKRFAKIMVALLLMAAMIVTLCPAVSAAHFKDVLATMDAKYRDAINYVSDNGIIIGDDLGYFYADQKIYRADYVLILYRLSGDFYIDYDTTDDFTDVSTSDYFYHAVGWAVENNITSGATATTFNPYGYVTREQAFTFLYRLAGHMNYDQNADEVISQSEDYALVSTYAYDPISWVYEYGILTRDALTDEIFPNTEITRKEVALYAARFRRNVEGIVFGRDDYSFSNSDEEFVSSINTTLLMSRNEWSRFVQYAGSEGMIVEDITDVAANLWGGSCYGMAISTVLDYLGKIDINGNYSNETPTMHSIPKLSNLSSNAHQLTTDWQNPSIDITLVESKINFYQISMYIPSVKVWKARINRDDGLEELLTKLEHSGIGVFCYSWQEWNNVTNKLDTYAHAVVAYGKPIEIDGGYRVNIYDNRFPYEDVVWLEIAKDDANEWTARMTTITDYVENVAYCKFLDDFSVYDNYDIDNYDNIATVRSIGVLDRYAMLDVCATGNFKITNEHGESFVFDLSTGNVDSDGMEVYGIDFIPKSKNGQIVIQFLVDPGETYTCEMLSEGNIISFNARTHGKYDSINSVSGQESILATLTLNDE